MKHTFFAGKIEWQTRKGKGELLRKRRKTEKKKKKEKPFMTYESSSTSLMGFVYYFFLFILFFLFSIFLWGCFGFAPLNLLYGGMLSAFNAGVFDISSPYCPSAGFLKSLGPNYLQLGRNTL